MILMTSYYSIETTKMNKLNARNDESINELNLISQTQEGFYLARFFLPSHFLKFY